MIVRPQRYIFLPFLSPNYHQRTLEGHGTSRSGALFAFISDAIHPFLITEVLIRRHAILFHSARGPDSFVIIPQPRHIIVSIFHYDKTASSQGVACKVRLPRLESTRVKLFALQA